MLSIEDIKNVSFRRANFGGYKPQDVDAFIDDLQVSYEALVRDKKNLEATVAELNEKVAKFHEEDSSIKKIILRAQDITEKSLNQARVKTRELVERASEESEKMIAKAKKEVAFQSEISENLKKEAMHLKQKLEDIYKEHMVIIEKIPAKVKPQDSTGTRDSSECEEPKKPELPKSPKVPMEDVSGGNQSHKPVDAFFGEHKFHVRKLKNLKFGPYYDPNLDKMITPADEPDPEATTEKKGSYWGLFRKNK